MDSIGQGAGFPAKDVFRRGLTNLPSRAAKEAGRGRPRSRRDTRRSICTVCDRVVAAFG